MTQYRQGDVYLIRVQALPDGARPIRRSRRGIVLAEGEATGHAHIIVNRCARVFEATSGARFL